MAYGLKYYNELIMAHWNLPIRIEILEDGFTGAPTLQKIGAKIQQGESGNDVAKTIVKTQIKLSILSKTDQQFIEFFTNNDTQFLVNVKVSGNIVASGFIESDSYNEGFNSDRNYNINVTAKDNLAKLENEKYVDSNGDQYEGFQTLFLILNNCLAKTGQTLFIDDKLTISYSSQVGDILSSIKVVQDGFVNSDGEIESCLYVLEEILKGLGAQIRMIGNQWHIREQADFWNLPQLNKSVDFKFINSDADFVLNPSWKEFKLIQDYKYVENSFKYFPKNIDDYTFVGPNQGSYIINDWNMQDIPFVNLINNGRDGFLLRPASDPNYNPNPIGAIGTKKQEFKQSNLDIIIKLRAYVYGIHGVSDDIKIDVILEGDNGQDYILDDSGWINYNGTQSKLINFSSIKSSAEAQDLTVTIGGIPTDGTINLRLWPSDATSNVVGHVYEDIIYTLNFNQGGSDTGAEITGKLNEKDNFAPDNIEVSYGEVPNDDNSKHAYYGGFYDTNENVITEWKRPQDQVYYGLLEVVGRGYANSHRSKGWQISTSMLFKGELWSNLLIEDRINKGSYHRMMINYISWDMSSGQAEVELVEVFEYNPSYAPIFEESQITDGTSNDFFVVNDNKDFLAYSVDEGAPKRISDLNITTDLTAYNFIVDKVTETESKRVAFSTLQQAILADIDLSDYYTKTESDDRYYTKTHLDANFAKIAGDSGQNFNVNDIDIFGDLKIRGEIQHLIGQAVIIDNAWIELNSGNNEVDSGLMVDIDGAGSAFSKLYRKASDDTWYIDSDKILLSGNNLSELSNIVTARSNLSVYSILESDNRFVDNFSNESISGFKTFTDFIRIEDGITTSTYQGGFAGSGLELDVQNDVNLTVDNLTVRKTTRFYEVEIKKIRNIGGSLLVTNGSAQESATQENSKWIFQSGVWQSGSNYVWTFTDIWQ